jgi:hypothetical protein
MNAYDSTSFTAGQECGARTAAVIARFAALELVGCSRWWSRWKRRLMARALVACAEEIELAADGDGLRPFADCARCRSPWHSRLRPPGDEATAPDRFPGSVDVQPRSPSGRPSAARGGVL